jgi:translation initiation factor RLI1
MEKIDSVLSYPAMTKTYDSFKISVQPGKYQKGKIVVMLG